MKKYILELLIIVGAVFVGICTIKYYSISSNLLFLLSSNLSESVFFTVLIAPLVFLTFPIIIYKKGKREKLTIKHIIIMFFIIISIFIIILNFRTLYEMYKIDGRKVYGIEGCVRILGDAINNETIDINAKNLAVISRERPKKSRYGGIRPGSYSYYYLKINDGEYVIPIKNGILARELIYTYTYGEKSVNTITVYENSKLVKAINGLELTANENEINEFLENKYYSINIEIQPNKTIKYKVKGCSTEEFIKNHNLWLGVFDSKDKRVFTKKITKTSNELPVNLTNGNYYVYICGFGDMEFVKFDKINSVKYTIKDRTITEIEYNN